MPSTVLERVDNFYRSITPTDRVCVIHHTDPDGVCSGVIAAKTVERLRNKPIDLRHNQLGSEHVIMPSTVKLLKKHRINKVITTDFTPDEDANAFKKLESFAKVLIIDHHKIYNDLNSERTVMIKPQLCFKHIEPSRYCTSKLAWDLGSRQTDINDLDWVASVGIVGDMATPVWLEFFKKVLRKYKLPFKKDPFKTIIGQVAATLSSAESYSNSNVRKCFEIVYNARHPREVLKSSIAKFRKHIDKELKFWINNFKNAEHHKELEYVFYLVKPKLNIKSPLSTIISIKHPGKTIFIVDVRKGVAHVSARRQDKKVAVNSLIENAVKGIKGAHGGGHVPAAGATLPAKYLPLFKQRILEQLENVYRTS